MLSNDPRQLAVKYYKAGDRRLIGIPGFSVEVPGGDDGFRPLRLAHEAGDVIYPECSKIKPAFVQAAGLYNLKMISLHHEGVNR